MTDEELKGAKAYWGNESMVKEPIAPRGM